MENEVKHLRLHYCGQRPVSFGGTGARLRCGESALISSVEFRFYMRKHRDDVLVENERTGEVIHVGANFDAVDVMPEAQTPEEQKVTEEVVASTSPEVEIEPEPAVETTTAPSPSPAVEVEVEVEVFEPEVEETPEVEEAVSEDESVGELREMLAEVAPKLADDAVDGALAVLAQDDFTADDLVKVKGIGKATANKIMAQFEED